MLDFVGHVLKYVGPIVATIIAIVALRKDTRDATTGKLTPAGRWFERLILLAAVLTVGAQLLDDMRQARSTAEQLKQNVELLNQVIRGQYPLQNVRASYGVLVTGTSPGVAAYENELADAMPKVASQIASREYRKKSDIWFSSVDPRDGIMFCDESPLMPSLVSHADAAKLVGGLNVRVLFYREPVAPEVWPLFVVTGARAIQPDLEMWFTGGDRCIEYRARQEQFVLRDISAETNASNWQSSGKIVSIMDLRGAQMVVDIHPRRTDQYVAQPLLRDFELFVGQLQALWIPAAKFFQRKLPNGDVVYEFRYPDTLEAILSLQRRSR